MLNFTIVVNDGGELKSVTSAEIDAWAKCQINENGNCSLLPSELDEALNAILDARAIEAGEYDPSDNDVPIDVIVGDWING